VIAGRREEPRGPDCPSDLGLHRLMVNDLGAGDAGAAATAAIRAHIDSCPRCGRRLARFESVPLPPLAALPVAARRPWRRRSIAAAGFGVAAAAALLLFVRRADDPPAGPTAVRPKGAVGLGVVVRRASGATDRIASGAEVAAGDLVRFEVTHAGPGHAAVVGLDSRRVVTVYVPQQGALPFLAGAGTTLLPGAVKLDDAPGEERLFALLCREGIPPGDIRRRAGDRLAAASGRPAEVTTLDLPCDEAAFLLRKAARP
jgi:hypothetical protein